jgi:hypothetical protein
MKSYKLAVICLSVLFILFSVGILVYDFYFTSDVIATPMLYQTSNKLGINTNTDALNFGKNIPGSTSTRQINISNTQKYSVSVSIKLTGDLAQFVTVSDNDFILAPNATREIIFYVQTPKDTPQMNFTGVATVVVNRVLFH